VPPQSNAGLYGGFVLQRVRLRSVSLFAKWSTPRAGLWDFYNAGHLFESSHVPAPIFCFDVTRRH
jgi:hypothetical protein